MSVKEPKVEPKDTVRKLRLELCALADELTHTRALLRQAAEIAARSECRRHGVVEERDKARRLLREVWEVAMNDGVPFFERLNLLRHERPRVIEALKALEKGEVEG